MMVRWAQFNRMKLYTKQRKLYYEKNKLKISIKNRLKREVRNPPALIDLFHFKFIPGLEDRYSISKEGLVVSHIRHHPVILIGGLMTSGYKYVSLRVKFNNKFKSVNKSIHRLVAMTYLSNWDEDLWVNHIDCNKLNNNVYNLEMCTAKGNNDHTILTGNIVRNKKGMYESSRN